MQPDNFLDALRASPEGRKITEAAAREPLVKRQKLAAELAEADARSAREWPKAFAANEEDAKAVRAAEKALAAANERLRMSSLNRAKISDQYTQHRAQLEYELSKSASPLLDAFEREMRNEMDRLRRPEIIELRDKTSRNEITGKVSRGQISNVESINARCRACMGAIESARDMKLVADQSAVPAALDAVRAGLPPIGSV